MMHSSVAWTAGAFLILVVPIAAKARRLLRPYFRGAIPAATDTPDNVIDAKSLL